MMLSAYDDPDTAADLALSAIEAEIERLPDELSHFRDRTADIAERLRDKAINAPRRPQ